MWFMEGDIFEMPEHSMRMMMPVTERQPCVHASTSMKL